MFRDALDHDKGQKSAMSGKFLHLIFEFFPVDFSSLFLQAFLCKLVYMEIAPKCGEICLSSRRIYQKAQNPVKSLAVMFFFDPDGL